MGVALADFTTLKDWAIADHRALSGWREEAEEAYAFAAGHQWSSTDKAKLEEAGRVPVVFNRIAVIVSSVVGSEINNRTEVRFLPREIGDAEPNEVLSAGAEWFRDQSGAEDEDSEAFEDVILTGVGVTETTLDWDEDPDGEPKSPRIDPLEMAWDCHAHRKGLSDAQRVHRIRDIPIREARDMFPGVKDEDLHAGWVDGGQEDDASDDPHMNPIGDQYAEGDGPGRQESRRTVRIVQTQWCERERSVEVAIPGSAAPISVSPAKYERLAAMAPGLPARRVNRKVWRQAFLGANSILKQNQPCPTQCTFTFITGHYDRKEKRFYGLLRSMKDPQRFANKWLSQVLHIVNSNAKGGVMAETGVTDDHSGFEESWAAADGVSWLKDGSITQGKIMPKPITQMPSALMSLTEYAVSSIRDVSGVNLELLGLRDANQPGVLEYQRRQSAMTTLAGFFDAMRYYRKRQGHVILHFLREHIAPTGRLVRIVEEGQAQYVPLAVDPGVAKYDVIVDDAPQAPNQKERNWEIISQLLPVFADKMQADDWALVAEYSPLPAALVERIKAKAVDMKEAGPSPAQQLEMGKVQSEIAANQARAREDNADAAVKEAEAQIAPWRGAVDIQKTRAEAAAVPLQAMPRPGASPA